MATKAKNPKSKSKSTKKENEVTDTATDTIESADTTAEVAEAVDAATEDNGALSSKSDIAPEDALFEAIVNFSSDRNTEALQEVYRSVHASSRGKAQGIAMKKAMTEGNVDMDVLGDVLDAFNNLPAATKTTRTKPKVDEGTVAAIRLAGLMVGFEALRAELGEDAYAEANAWYGGEAPEEHRSAVLKVAENVQKASGKGVRSSRGGRSSMREKISDLVARGALAPGDVLTGANDVKATIDADGKLTTVNPQTGEEESFDNPSAAARVHRVKDDGTVTSTNGWDFWQTESGQSVGDLRQS